MIGYARLTAPEEARTDRFTMQTSWTCHVFFPDSKKAPAFFGLAYYTFVNEDGAWRIGKKRTVLQNDYIPTMLDIYCI
jgi:3-phenylpropionate/cinnamic acid dioxygenase small subunit